ncbi:hypothetical protein Dimus_026082 [Dionaea muscipula]
MFSSHSLTLPSFTLIIILISYTTSAAAATTPVPHAAAVGGGRWELLQRSIGISAMHMQLLYNDRVVLFDRTDFGLSNLSLPAGQCREDPNDTALTTDCTAHSAEYDVAANSIRPLVVHTDVWCSAGGVTPDGRLIQTGGYNDGERVVRVFQPCDTCDWQEIGAQLLVRRWYTTDHILPDGVVIILGGRRQYNYEFYPKTSLFSLPFLAQTNDPGSENNLYPFVILNVDGNLFVFANNRAILLDYTQNAAVKTYPMMPGGDPRNYPSTGSAALLPLTNLEGSVEAEVLVCGGAPKGSFQQALKGQFVRALDSCGRIKITHPSPEWSMETMPLARVMGDLLMLPNGHLLIINGAGAGTAGWEYGRDPVLNPVIYRPDDPEGSRFEVQNPTTIPRMYHSSAIVVRDGRVLVGGSNPHVTYNFTALYPTELSLEAFHPPYLDPNLSDLRPEIISPAVRGTRKRYGDLMIIRFAVSGTLDSNMVKVTMMSPPFNTHSFSMSQRLLVLSGGGEGAAAMRSVRVTTSQWYNSACEEVEVQVRMPGSANLAPPGYYLLFVVHQDIPSEGIWIHIQ